MTGGSSRPRRGRGPWTGAGPRGPPASSLRVAGRAARVPSGPGPARPPAVCQPGARGSGTLRELRSWGPSRLLSSTTGGSHALAPLPTELARGGQAPPDRSPCRPPAAPLCSPSRRAHCLPLSPSRRALHPASSALPAPCRAPPRGLGSAGHVPPSDACTSLLAAWSPPGSGHVLSQGSACVSSPACPPSAWAL